MTGKSAKQVVRVTIVGEEYSIRSEATPEHTRAVAAYVDEAIRRVLNGGGVVEPRKAAILAALQITDELMQAEQAAQALTGSLSLVELGGRAVAAAPKRKGLSGI